MAEYVECQSPACDEVFEKSQPEQKFHSKECKRYEYTYRRYGKDRADCWAKERKHTAFVNSSMFVVAPIYDGELWVYRFGRALFSLSDFEKLSEVVADYLEKGVDNNFET